VSEEACISDRRDGLFRFIHRHNANADGTLNSGAFSLRRDPQISVGLESLITPAKFDEFCQIKPDQGVARVSVGDAIDLEFLIHLDPEPDWGEFKDTHCVLTGYQSWTNKKKEEAARKLRDLANASILKRPK
jgi:hypothetical protein